MPAHGFRFRPVGRVSFLCLPKEKVPKEKAPDMLAHSESLWVPCDARMTRRGANSLRSDRRTPKPPTHPVLLGKPERGFGSTSTPDTDNTVIPA